MSIGSVIKEARLKKNIKQTTVAQEVGVTVQTYIKWESDETEPKASQVVKLSKILEISSNSICTGQEDKKMEMTQFIRYFSKVMSHSNNFEVGLTIWETVENDNDFIEKLRKHAGVQFHYDNEDYDPITGEVTYYRNEFGQEIEVEDPIYRKK